MILSSAKSCSSAIAPAACAARGPAWLQALFHVGANVRRRAGPHAGIEAAGERGEIDPLDAQARAVRARSRLDHDRAGAVRKGEAQEVRLHRQPALGVERAPYPRRSSAGTSGTRIRRRPPTRSRCSPARTDRRGGLDRHHRRGADRLEAGEFERAAAELAVHGAGVAGHEIVALRRRGREHLQVLTAEACILQRRLTAAALIEALRVQNARLRGVSA